MANRSRIMDQISGYSCLCSSKKPSQLSIDKALAFIQIVPSYCVEGIQAFPSPNAEGIDINYEIDPSNWFSLRVRNDGTYLLELSDGTIETEATMYQAMKAFYDFTQYKGQDHGQDHD